MPVGRPPHGTRPAVTNPTAPRAPRVRPPGDVRPVTRGPGATSRRPAVSPGPAEGRWALSEASRPRSAPMDGEVGSVGPSPPSSRGARHGVKGAGYDGWGLRFRRRAALRSGPPHAARGTGTWVVDVDGCSARLLDHSQHPSTGPQSPWVPREVSRPRWTPIDFAAQAPPDGSGLPPTAVASALHPRPTCRRRWDRRGARVRRTPRTEPAVDT